MAYEPLDAREWLESQRLTGCKFADELLDLLDGIREREEMGSALEDIHRKAPDIVNGSKLELHEHKRIADWACGRLDLLDSIEAVLEEFSLGFEFDTRTVDSDDKLRAMFESGRWLTYDL